MPLGAFAPLPLRLGHDFNAAQSARAFADMMAASLGAPLFVFTFTHTGAALVKNEYFGMNGTGTAYAPTGAIVGTGESSWNFPTQSFEDPYEIVFGITPRHGIACVHSSSAAMATVTIGGTSLFKVKTFTDAGVALNAKATVAIW